MAYKHKGTVHVYGKEKSNAGGIFAFLVIAGIAIALLASCN